MLPINRTLTIWGLVALILSACQPLQPPVMQSAPAVPAVEQSMPAAPAEPHGLRPDAPEYAKHGPFAVGYKPIVIGEGTDHPLDAGLWYPALNPDGVKEEVTYTINTKIPVEGMPATAPIYGHALLDAEIDASAAPYPLVIYSHGFAANAAWVSTLLEHYASYGFIVLAPEHTEQFDFDWSEIPNASIDRPNDVKQTLDYAEELNAPDGALAGLIDMGNVAVVGHSYGGYTALAMAGAQYDLDAFNARCAALAPDDMETFLCAPIVAREAEMAARVGLDPMPEGLWPSFGDPRVTAIIPMAGDSYLFDQAGLAKITIPMMAIGGTADTGTPYAWGSRPAYDYASSARKTLVTFEGGEHFIMISCADMPWWSETPFYGWVCFDPVWDKDRSIDLVNHFTTAFLLTELKGDAEAAAALAAENVSFPGIQYETTGYGAVSEATPSTGAEVNGWPISTPEEQGIDSEKLLAALNFIQDKKIPIHSLLIIRDGKLLLDAYMHPYTPDTRHQIYSVTKSVLSALVGIAIEQGYIKNIDQPVVDFFPEWQIANLDETKQAMTLRHLLTMSSGLDFTNSVEDYEKMAASDNWGQHVLNLPMAAKPGAEFVYCDGCAHLVGFILTQATGMPLREFADKNLFSPLGITDYTWHVDAHGQPFGYFGIGMKPRDMAKLGYLYLHKGQWEEKQLVPRAWVELTTCGQPAVCPFQKIWDPIGYGYFWWMWPDFYTAAGRGGQWIMVAPDQDIVIVMTAGGVDISDMLFPGIMPFDLVTDRILPAAATDQPLPANPDGLGALETRVSELAQPKPAPVAPLPELAGQVDGQVYEFSDRPLDLFFSLVADDLVDDAHEAFGDVGTYEVKAMRLSFEEAEALLTLTFTDDYTVELPVGLDGIYRIADTRLGPLAARGAWHADDEFRMEIASVGNSHLVKLAFFLDDTPIQIVGREMWEHRVDTWAAWPRAEE